MKTSSVEHCQDAINLEAAKQFFPAHWHHRDNTKIAPSNYCTDDPIQTAPCPHDLQWLIGRKRGRTTVMGYFGRMGKRKYMVVKCLCGCYELMNVRTAMSRERGENMCAKCRTRNHHNWLKTK